VRGFSFFAAMLTHGKPGSAEIRVIFKRPLGGKIWESFFTPRTPWVPGDEKRVIFKRPLGGKIWESFFTHRTRWVPGDEKRVIFKRPLGGKI
jgi:hypothetical protein